MLSGSRREIYLLPLCPAVALLAARRTGQGLGVDIATGGHHDRLRFGRPDEGDAEHDAGKPGQGAGHSGPAPTNASQQLSTGGSRRWPWRS